MADFTLSDLKAEVAAFREAEAAAPVGPYCDMTCPNDTDPDTYFYGYGELRTAPRDDGRGFDLLLKVPEHEDYDDVLKFCAACRPSDDTLHWSRRMEWMIAEIGRLRDRIEELETIDRVVEATARLAALEDDDEPQVTTCSCGFVTDQDHCPKCGAWHDIYGRR